MKHKKTLIGIVLLAFCIACRFVTSVADFYAERLYPAISRALSWVGSLTHFSLEEIVVLAFVATLVGILFRAIRHREGFFRWLGRSLVVVMWLLVWFYMGWGNNYYRTGLYERNGIQRVSYSEESFSEFLKEYAAALNQSAAQAGDYNGENLETEIRSYYTVEVVPYGYTSLKDHQHIKKPLFSWFFSAVRVQGYIGPFLCESQVNADVLPSEYPYVAAHEMAHLAGVTSEAEASWWGFDCCRRSVCPAVRYSGYLSVLPYVLSNAQALLAEDDYLSWVETICPKARADYNASREYWKGKRIGWIDRVQGWVYDLFLRSNGVSEGRKDYYGVVGMIMTMDAITQRNYRH